MRAGDESGPVSVDGLSHSIVGTDDGFERYVLQKEPTSEKSQWNENAACLKIYGL